MASLTFDLLEEGRLASAYFTCDSKPLPLLPAPGQSLFPDSR